MDDSFFQLELLDQYWISGSRDPWSDPEDSTSHGKVALVVHGQDISGCEDSSTDYGINQSAVALLRTVLCDHTPVQWQAGVGYSPIFFHGCEIFGTCPVCIIDFRVRHMPSRRIILDDFYVTGGPKGADPNRFRHLSVEMDSRHYARQVLEFAKKALSFLPPQKGMDYEIPNYVALREEHQRLIRLVEEWLEGPVIIY